MSTAVEGDEPDDAVGKGWIAEGFADHQRAPWTMGLIPRGCRGALRCEVPEDGAGSHSLGSALGSAASLDTRPP